MFSSDYYQIDQRSGISPFQTMVAYLGGSAFQTIIDNPVTAYRQLIQQYAKDTKGEFRPASWARNEANMVFKASPVSASVSGLGPRLIGVGFKRVPKFGFFLGITYVLGDESPGMLAATGASIMSAPFINPIRMIEKQQRAFFKQTNKQKPILEIIRESKAKNFRPLFRGTLPLMGHSLASATTGLVGQPQLKKWVDKQLSTSSGLGQFATGLISSAIVSPIYVAMTNPLSRLEVIMQTSKISGKSISLRDALADLAKDSKENGLRGMFRGQGIGIAKAVISLTMFHQGRIWCMDQFKDSNKAKGLW